MLRIQIAFNSGDLAFQEITLSRSCRDSGTRLVPRKHRFRWTSMTGQSVNPEQRAAGGATRLELGTKANEESNLAPTYSEYRFMENVNRRGEKSAFRARRNPDRVWSNISNGLKRLGFRSRKFLARLVSESSRACTIRVRRFEEALEASRRAQQPSGQRPIGFCFLRRGRGGTREPCGVENDWEAC
jgi:hypothetical protein